MSYEHMYPIQLMDSASISKKVIPLGNTINPLRRNHPAASAELGMLFCVFLAQTANICT